MASTRLPPETFEIPAAEIRRGYRSAIYFNRAKQIAASLPDMDRKHLLMQVFQKNDAVLCGIDEALAILRVGAGRWHNDRKAMTMFDRYMEAKLGARSAGRELRSAYLRELVELEDWLDSAWISEFDELDVRALNEGDLIAPWEPVMHIKGRYSSFAHLESVYLGVLARRTLVATNTRRVVEAANGKQVLFFADRFDHWATQGGDGYAAHIGGATGMASDAMAAWWGEKGIGTMPHALIAFFDNNSDAREPILGSKMGGLPEACHYFRKEFPDTNLVALVDYNNNCVVDSIHAYECFKDKLWGVRLDTSENMVDQWFWSNRMDEHSTVLGPPMGDFKPTGVNPVLVEEVRRMLDARGGHNVKIIVSGGFNPEKIAAFEKDSVPVDVYAVGSSLLRGTNDYTADIVPGKKGRWKRDGSRLEIVK